MKVKSVSLVAMILVAAGCATERHITDARHPEIAIKADGGVTYRGRYVEPEDLPGLLRDSGFTRTDTINIYCPDGQSDFRTPSRVMTVLLRGGFPRSVLVGERKSYSHAGREEKGRQARPSLEPGPSRTAPRIRYK